MKIVHYLADNLITYMQDGHVLTETFDPEIHEFGILDSTVSYIAKFKEETNEISNKIKENASLR